MIKPECISGIFRLRHHERNLLQFVPDRGVGSVLEEGEDDVLVVVLGCQVQGGCPTLTVLMVQ